MLPDQRRPPDPPRAGSRSITTLSLLLRLFLLVPASAVDAQELWSWHSFDFALVKTRQAELTLHNRLRTRQGDFQQGRSGAVLKLAPHPRAALIGGYYYGREEDTREEWQTSHRLFAGAEALVYRRGAASLAYRGLVERFITGGARPAFFRFRHRTRISTNHRISPYASGEWFWDARGYLAARYQGGLRWRVSKWASVEAGYMYDARSPSLGPVRHGLVTLLQLEPRREQRRPRSE